MSASRHRRVRLAGLLVALPVLGLLVALVVGLAQPAAYRATATAFVSTNASDVQTLSSGSSFAVHARDSFADVAMTPLVLGRVVSQLGLRTTPAQLAQHVHVSAPADMTLIDVTVQEASPVAAAVEANAIVRAIGGVAPSLTPSGSANDFRITQVEVAVPPAVPDRSALLRDLLIGGGAGLVAALLVLTVVALRRPPAGGAGLAAPSML